MSLEPRSGASDAPWVGVRNILVPHDIVAVPRVSPVRVRKQTLCRPRPEGAPIERAGGRDWFSDRLFIEGRTGRDKAASGTAMTAHASCMMGLVVVLALQPEPVRLAKVGAPLVMPALVSMMPVIEAASPAPRSRQQSAPQPVPQPPAAAPPVAESEGAGTPVEAPSSIEPETDVAGTPEGSADGSAGGVEGGVANGVAGGAIGGATASGGLASGPLRLVAGMDPPRKIKDVKPVYPLGGLSDRARGTVIIECTVGVDGKVHNPKVINSVPQLDQAAIDAVMQWEFVPSRLNGVPVAVLVTIIVQFSIH